MRDLAAPRRRLPGLDDDLPDEVRHQVPVLTLGRLVGNGCFRFVVPFLGVIAAGLGVPLTTMGTAVSAGEFTGLLAPFIGHRVDRSRRSRAMTAGMVVLAFGALAASVSRGPATIAAGFVCISVGKLLYDPAMGAWVADRVSYARRSRVIGFTELSWAGAMLLVIPLLGLLVAGPGWRWAYVVMAAAALAMSVVVRRRLHDEPHPVGHDTGGRFRPDRATIVGLVGFGLLMTAANAGFVVFGAWLGDAFHFSAAGIGLTGVLLGVVELVATSTTIRVTDRLGKRTAMAMGAGLMVPAGLSLGVTGTHVVVGLASFALYVLGFEFAIVSALPLVAELQPTARAGALGLAVGIGTVGRGVMSIVSTRVYSAHGIGGSGLIGALCAVGVVVATTLGLGRQTRLR